METKIYLKQLEGWATDLKIKYWNDPFNRSQLNVIAVQVIFALLLISFVYIYYNYLYKDIFQTIIDGITQSIQSNKSISGEEIAFSMQTTKEYYFATFFLIALIITIVFSYLISKITLTPARDALESQKRFISNLAHELRTPISIIKTNMEVSLLDTDMKKDFKKMIESNIEELDRASEVINNLLTFNKLIRPEKISFDVVDLSLVVESAANKLKGLAEKKNITVKIKKTPPDTVWGNKTALDQIVVNLFKNSINYTPKNGFIDITIEPDYRGGISLRIQDNGVGIAKEDLKHIFEPFFRAEKSRHRGLGSSGLGLTIVSELIKLHSGRIVVQSEPNRGTLVNVMLPYYDSKQLEKEIEKEDRAEVSVNFLNK